MNSLIFFDKTLIFNEPYPKQLFSIFNQK